MPLVSILMGSKSDWPLMKETSETLDSLGIEHESRAISAHRAPEQLVDYIADAEARGVELFIAGAGGAAHLPGVVASRTARPVLGVPVEGASLGGLDSLLSIVQMPGGVPVATFAIGKAGARNAAYFAARVLAASHPEIQEAVAEHRSEMAALNPDPLS